MIFRKAMHEDVLEIETIIDDAKQRLKQMGIDQWQNGYPNRASIIDDITNESLFILCNDTNICAITTVMETPEPTYSYIDGAWGNSNHYLTLHRVATAQRIINKGSSYALFEAIKNHFPDTVIRIDTHRDNLPMKRLLEKSGFTYRGVIFLEDGAPRDAFDWIPV